MSIRRKGGFFIVMAPGPGSNSWFKIQMGRCFSFLLTSDIDQANFSGMSPNRKIKNSFIALVLAVTVSPLFAGDIVSLVKECEGCHGKDGNSIQPDVPTIAGFSREGFLNTIDVFREDERIALRYQKPGEPETVMNEIAKRLSDEDVQALADYYSKRPFRAAKQEVDKALAERGEVIHKQHCERCHSGNGADPVEDAAILAGQWTPYLRRQFQNILSGKRQVPRSMLRRVRKLEENDIEALLNFYAAQGQGL
jgi:sulfide dehydrogenase cytochrome subunit